MHLLKVPFTIVAIIVSALLVVLAVGATISTLRPPQEFPSEPSAAPVAPLTVEGRAFIERMGPDATPEELVVEYVKEIRAEFEFPQQASEFETATGIEGRGRVVTLQYDAFNLENLPYDRATHKDVMVQLVCEEGEMRYLLGAGVEFVYEYTVVDTGRKFSVSVTDADCR